VIAEGEKEIAFNSGQARDFLAGREGRPPIPERHYPGLAEG